MKEVTSNSSTGWYLIALVSTLSFLALIYFGQKDSMHLERLFKFIKKTLQLLEMQSFWLLSD